MEILKQIPSQILLHLSEKPHRKIDLYKKGREYRKEAPSMWCPTCSCSIAQVELEDVEIDSFFNDITFTVENNGKEEDLIIATTRPELLPACVAILHIPTMNVIKI